jgi:hypothetical protein
VANLLLSKGEEYGQKLEKGMQGQVLSPVYILPVWGKLSIWQSIPAFKARHKIVLKLGHFGIASAQSCFPLWFFQFFQKSC